MSDSENSTTLPDVSRRELLAAAVVAPLTPTGGSQTPAASDPVLPLWGERQRLHAQAVGLCHRWSELETHLIREIGFPKVVLPCAESPNGHCAFTHEDIDRAFAMDEQPSDAKAELHARLASHQARWDAEAGRIGFFEADRQQLEGWKKEAEATRKIFATPATTLSGIKIKIALMIQLCRTGSDVADFPLPQLRSTLADVERLQRSGNIVFG
jgi:hypothetical protein